MNEDMETHIASTAAMMTRGDMRKPQDKHGEPHDGSYGSDDVLLHR